MPEKSGWGLVDAATGRLVDPFELVLRFGLWATVEGRNGLSSERSGTR
ncbi:MAG: hypothetical protein ABFD63_04050 [Smithella sp.]